MDQAPPNPRRPLVVATIVALSTIFGGIWFHRTEQQHLQEIMETDLLAIAQLKTAQIEDWRNERLAGAAILMETPFFVREATQWLNTPSPTGREHLAARFESLCRHYGYSDVMLTDREGQVRLRLKNEDQTLHPEALAVLQKAMTEHRAVLSDLHAGGTNQRPHLDVAAPLFGSDDPSSRATGAVILQVDAEQFLYPLVRSRSIHNHTAEILLVTQDGNDALLLNTSHQQSDTAFKLRIPLPQTDAPAVMAVTGRQGIARGTDYRGVEVISALEAIPDSPWFVVAKKDVAEAFASQHSQSILIVLLILAVIAVASISVGIVWQRNQKTYFQSLVMAEQATRESEEKYRALFEDSQDAIVTQEPPSWNFTSCNPAAVRLFGTENRDQFLTYKFSQVSPEKQPDGQLSTEAAVEKIEIALREGSHSFEWTCKRLNGETFWAAILLSRIERNGSVFLQATVRDITERKRIENELRWKTAFLEAQLNASIDGTLVVDQDNKRLLATPQLVQLWKVPQQILDDPDDTALLDYVVGRVKDPDQFLAKVKYLYDHPDETSRDEVEFKDGMVFDRYTAPVVDGEGHYYGRVWTFRDITSRRQMEEKLAVTAARWDATFNSITDLISVQDLDHKLIAVNKAYAETFGKTPEELIGSFCYEIVHKSREPLCQCPCDVVFETHESTQTEIFEPTLNAHLAVSVSPLFDPNGQVTGCVHIAKDISERKRAEQKQNELLSQLAETNEELKQFAYVVSHDLKAPLRAIRILSDWLIADCHDALDEQGRENLQLLGSRVNRMANLIDGILQYSRAGRTEKLTPVDLGELVSEIISILDAPEHITIRVDEELPTVEGDETRLGQVFQNLLSNAIKYMDKPQGEITVGCVEEDGFWKFSVSDNGPGIEEKHFQRIFQLFQTLSPKDTRESTGVGLAIIKKIAEMYGGRVWVESQIGEGSTFYFTLPRAMSTTACASGKTVTV